MFYSPKVFWTDKWIYVPGVIALIFEVLIWLYAAFYVRGAAEPVFLHYNVVFGVDLIGEWWKVLYVPMSGFIIFLINFILAWWVYGQDKILARFFTFITACLNIFLALAFYLLVGLNI